MEIIKLNTEPRFTKKDIESKYPFLTISDKWERHYYYCKATINQDCKYGKKGTVIANYRGTLTFLEKAIYKYIQQFDDGNK